MQSRAGYQESREGLSEELLFGQRLKEDEEPSDNLGGKHSRREDGTCKGPASGVFEQHRGGQCGWRKVIERERERLGGEGGEGTEGEDFALTLSETEVRCGLHLAMNSFPPSAAWE